MNPSVGQSDCRHEDSMWGRCVACGMTWKQQAAQRGPDDEQLGLAEDSERLADIGDLILTGASIEEFDLGKWERIVVESYVKEARR